MFIGISTDNGQGSRDFGYSFQYHYNSNLHTGGISSQGAHSHTISGNTSSAGAHTHTLNGAVSSGGAHTHTISGSITSAGAHTHTIDGAVGAVSGASTGTSGNLPPYYSLYFIIKYKSAANSSSTVHNLKVYRYIK